MKVVYNWLKDFVDVTATPHELASRLALSGTNIGGVETSPHGAVIEAEVSSNRPDCLGHLGIAREVGAIFKQPVVFTPPRPEESEDHGLLEDGSDFAGNSQVAEAIGAIRTDFGFDDCAV